MNLSEWKTYIILCSLFRGGRILDAQLYLWINLIINIYIFSSSTVATLTFKNEQIVLRPQRVRKWVAFSGINRRHGTSENGLYCSWLKEPGNSLTFHHWLRPWYLRKMSRPQMKIKETRCFFCQQRSPWYLRKRTDWARPQSQEMLGCFFQDRDSRVDRPFAVKRVLRWNVGPLRKNVFRSLCRLLFWHTRIETTAGACLLLPVVQL